MLSIGTITAGDGYKYLTKEVVSGVEDYYVRAGVGAGEAQGWWLGAQREAFGVRGGVVSDVQMAGFFGTKTDPATGEALGSKFRVYASVAERLERAEANQKGWVEEDLAVRSAALQSAGAGEERWADSLAAHQVAAEERWNKTRQKIERAGERNRGGVPRSRSGGRLGPLGATVAGQVQVAVFCRGLWVTADRDSVLVVGEADVLGVHRGQHGAGGGVRPRYRLDTAVLAGDECRRAGNGEGDSRAVG